MSNACMRVVTIIGTALVVATLGGAAKGQSDIAAREWINDVLSLTLRINALSMEISAAISAQGGRVHVDQLAMVHRIELEAILLEYREIGARYRDVASAALRSYQMSQLPRDRALFQRLFASQSAMNTGANLLLRLRDFGLDKFEYDIMAANFGLWLMMETVWNEIE